MHSDSDSTPTTPNPMIQDSRTLALFALLTVGLCVLTYLATRNQIQTNEMRMKIAALAEVAPDAAVYLDPEQDWIKVKHELLGYPDYEMAYAIHANTADEIWIFPLHAADGYGGSIHLLMGVNYKGEILGVRVVPPHTETPGLGDKIEIKRSDWIKSFNQLSLSNTQASDWAIKKDGGQFDAFTGASITPRAVVKSVYRGLIFHRDYQIQLQSTKLKTQWVIEP